MTIRLDPGCGLHYPERGLVQETRRDMVTPTAPRQRRRLGFSPEERI